MAQHDYVIANGTGSAVRSDLNDALAAIVSMNSGSTEPSTTFAFQFWADTNANLLKMRNSANDGWIELRQLDGEFTSVSVANGTAAAPSIFFNASGTDTGIYSNGTDSVDVSTGGTRRLDIGSAGDVTIRGGNVTLNAQGDLRLADSDSSNWVAFQAPATVASNVTWTLPSADGTNGDALTTNGSGTLSWTSAGGASITQGNTSAEVVDTGSDGHFKVTTEGTEALRVDSSQRVGIGTASPNDQLVVYNSATNGQCYLEVNNNRARNAAVKYVTTGGTWYTGASIGNDNNRFSIYESGVGDRLLINPDGSTVFRDAAEQMRIDSSGRLLVGLTTGANKNLLQVQGDVDNGATGVGGISLRRGVGLGSIGDGSQLGQLDFCMSDGGVAARIICDAEGAAATNDYPGRLEFYTTADGASSPTERMRINRQGYLRNNSGNVGMSVHVVGTSNNIFEGYNGASDGSYNGTTKIYIENDGDIKNTNNSYGAISDIKLKENIVDAASQWNDLKAIQVRNYNFKEETGHETHTQLGVIAQEIELVSPGLVSESPDRDEDGNDLGTTTKSVNYSVLYMKAVKALQEAMERIETLETANASLEARLTALETA